MKVKPNGFDKKERKVIAIIYNRLRAYRLRESQAIKKTAQIYVIAGHIISNGCYLTQGLSLNALHLSDSRVALAIAEDIYAFRNGSGLEV